MSLVGKIKVELSVIIVQQMGLGIPSVQLDLQIVPFQSVRVSQAQALHLWHQCVLVDLTLVH